MPIFRFLIFISVVLIIYGVIIFYIYRRAAGLFHLHGIPGILFRAGLIAMSMTFFLARFLQSRLPLGLFEALLKVGSYWLGVIVYLFLAVAAVDLVRLVMKALGIRPAFIYERLPAVRRALAAAVALTVTGIIGYGYWNARNVRITEMEISVPKRGAPPGTSVWRSYRTSTWVRSSTTATWRIIYRRSIP